MNDVISKVKEKYPEYRDVPDDQLTVLIGDKFPQYLSDKTFQQDFILAKGITPPFYQPGSPAVMGSAGGVPGLLTSLPPSETQLTEDIYGPGGLLAKASTPVVRPVQAIANAGIKLGYRLGGGEGPAPNIEELMSAPDAPRDVQVGAGTIKAISDLGDFFTSPVGVATLGIGYLPKTVQRVVGIGFATTMGKEIPAMASELGQEVGKPEAQRDYGKISSLVTSTALNTILTSVIAKHAAAPEAAGAMPSKIPVQWRTLAPRTSEAIEQTTKTGEPNAPQIRSQQESSLAEHPGTAPLGIPGETGRGNRVEQSGTEPAAQPQPQPSQSPDVAARTAALEAKGKAGTLEPEEAAELADLRMVETPPSTPTTPEKTAPAPTETPKIAEQTEVSVTETPMLGPGAKTVGEPAKAELAQLTDTLKTMAQQPKAKAETVFDLGVNAAKAKDSATAAVTGLKAVGSYLKERLIGKPVVTDYTLALGDRKLALSESVINARKFFKTAEKAVPDKLDREAISNWIDTGGKGDLLNQAIAETKDRYKPGYERAKGLSPELQTVALNMKNYFDARLQDAIDTGILEAGIEDYIHRTYESESPWKSGVLAELRSGVFTGKPALAKQRVFQYDFEAEKAGLKPIKDFVKRIAAYDLSLNKAIADRQLIKDMMAIKMSDGRPMIDVGGLGKKIEGPTGETDATLIKPSFKPKDAENPLNDRQDYKYYDHPALRKWKWVSTGEDGSPIFVQGDVLVHPEGFKQIKTLFDRSAIRQNLVGRAALGLSSTVKQTMLDLSGFHPVQITVHGWEHRTFKPVKEIDFENPDTRGLIRGGMVVGETSGQQLFSEGLTGSSLTRHIPGIGPKLQAYNEWLFNDYIPRLKNAMGLHALERNRMRFPNLTADEQYALTASQANAAFGELNWELMGRSKTTVDALRLGLLAPDFLLARAKFAAQALTKYGGAPTIVNAPTKFLGIQIAPKKIMLGEQASALLLGATTLYITARIMNKLINDEYHFEPRNAFSVVINKRAYSLRTVQGDLLHAVTDPGKFIFNRLNPTYGRTAFEFLTGRDYFGRSRNLIQQAQDFASTIVPISLRGLLNPREQNLLESVFNALGVTARRAIPIDTIRDLAEEYKKANKIRTDPGEFIYDPGKDPFRNIRQAAVFSDKSAVASEIANAVQKGDVTLEQIRKHFTDYANRPFTGSREHEMKFKKSLSGEQLKIYNDAMNERREIRTKFNAGFSEYVRNRKK